MVKIYLVNMHLESVYLVRVNIVDKGNLWEGKSTGLMRFEGPHLHFVLKKAGK